MSDQALRVTCPNCVALIEFPVVSRNDEPNNQTLHSGSCAACSHLIDLQFAGNQVPADPHSFANRQRAVSLL